MDLLLVKQKIQNCEINSINVIARFKTTAACRFIFKKNHFKNIAEHSDSMIEDGIATAAWLNLARSPACCQDSVEGSHTKISVRESPSF